MSRASFATFLCASIIAFAIAMLGVLGLLGSTWLCHDESAMHSARPGMRKLLRSLPKHRSPIKHAHKKSKAELFGQKQGTTIQLEGASEHKIKADTRVYFDEVRKQYEKNGKKTAPLSGKQTIFGRFQDVVDQSKAFAALRVETVANTTARLESIRAYPPLWPSTFCAHNIRHRTYLAEQKILAMGSCVVGKEKMPEATTAGLWWFKRSDEFKKKAWVPGGTDYHTFRRSDATCEIHLNKHPPIQRTKDMYDGTAQTPPYIIYARNAVVQWEGQVHAGNEHYVEPGPCYNAGYMDNNHCSTGPYPGYAQRSMPIKKIFVIAQIMGNGLFHFLVENLPRLALFHADLIADPEIKILVIPTDKEKKPSKAMLNFFEYLGISKDRVVHGFFKAKEVFVPQSIPCGASGERPMQLLALRDLLISRLPVQNPPMRTILLMQRDKGQRAPGILPNFKQLVHMMDTFIKMTNSNLKVEVFSDTDPKVLRSVKETGLLFNRAKVIIGKHGAGFSNIFFSQRDAVAVEIYDYGNPMCFMDLAMTMGMKHRFAIGNWGFADEDKLIPILLEVLDLDKKYEARPIIDAIRKDMPDKKCCKSMIGKCVACYYDKTEKEVCDEWRGISTGMPGCSK